MKKRLLALLLAALLVCALLPTAAFAAEEDVVAYPVEGGNIYFDPTTGTVTDADEVITAADIPAEINGVAVTSIGDCAFYYCYDMTNVTIPSSVTSIGDYAFYCTHLTSITIPSSVTSIENHAFSTCIHLSSIDVAAGNPNYCSVDGVLFNKAKTELFQCPIRKAGNYTIPDGVTSIGESAFSFCSSLTSITLPSSVTSIGNHAFQSCGSLTSIVIPNSVTSIGEGAFSSYVLSSIDVAAGNPNYCSVDGVLFNKAKTELLQCPGRKAGNYTIPDGVTNIGGSAFQSCTDLESVTIPNSVTSIGERAFNLCTSLTNIVIPNSVTSIGKFAFYSCTGLTSIMILNSVTSIGEWAFACCPNLTSIVIPESVTSIAKNAFDSCTGLTSVTIKNPECSIGMDAETLNSSKCTVIYGYTDSTAQAYAEEYGYEFIPLDGKPKPTEPKPTEPTPTDPKPSIPTPSTPAVTNPFADLKATAYYYQPVQWAYANNITAGTSATTFSPEQGCTRAQVVSFLWRAAGSPKPASSSNPFTDVKAGSYYYDAVLWAAEKGITAGTTATTFSPNVRVTRGQFVSFLYRFAGSPDVGGVKNPFNDLNTKAFYYNAVLWAVENGITAGTSTTTFSPEATCTRGQVVSFLYRYFN